MKFRKKPVEVDAVQYEGKGNLVDSNGKTPDWIWDAFINQTLMPTNGADPLYVCTLEGRMIVSPMDWIVRGVNGELYPVKPDIFEKTYELLTTPTKEEKIV